MSRPSFATPAHGFASAPARLPVAEKLAFAIRSAEREIVDFALTVRSGFNRAVTRAKAENRARLLDREMARIDPRLRRDIGYGPDRFGHGF